MKKKQKKSKKQVQKKAEKLLPLDKVVRNIMHLSFMLVFLIAVLIVHSFSDKIPESRVSIPTNYIVLDTNKDQYHSKENMQITTKIFSEQEFQGANLKLIGIYASRYRMDITEKVDITKGENVVISSYKLPNCNTCSGIREGSYDIRAVLSHRNVKILDTTTNISIQK